MRTRHLALAVLGLALAVPLFAQSQQEMNRQAYDDFEQADQQLNQVYQQLLPLVGDEEAVKKLRESQRVWVKFRDLEAVFAGDPMRGGSAEPLLRWGCKTRLTEQRTKELQEYLKFYQEDR